MWILSRACYCISYTYTVIAIRSHNESISVLKMSIVSESEFRLVSPHRASTGSPSADWPAEQASLTDLVHEQKTPVVVSESPRSQGPGALLSAFRLPISRGVCTRRAAPASLTHRTPATRVSHASARGSTLGQLFHFTAIPAS